MRIENRVERISAHHPMQKLLMLFLGSLVLLGGIIWAIDQLNVRHWVERLGWFSIEKVNVEASWPITQKQVTQWIPELEGKSLLALEVEPLVKLLNGKPWVDSITVSKKYPNQVTIQLSSKEPRAIVIKGKRPFYVDKSGSMISRVSPRLAKKFDLPVVSIMKQSTLVKWELNEALGLLENLNSALSGQYVLSELVMETFPYFRIYLANPRIEILFSEKTWEEQIPRLKKLLNSPPSQIRQMARINLVFPKKAIVSSSLSN